MDLSNLSVDPDNQTGTLIVEHPKTFAPLTDEDGNQVTITVHGPDSEVRKSIERKWQNKALSDGIKKRQKNISAEQIEAKALDLDVACTVDWDNLAFEGEELECTPKNVRKVYKALPWLREQVEEFMNDRSNFLGE